MVTRFAYFPGCAMKSTAQPCEATAHAAADALGIELCELERWTCCGTMFSLATDDLAHHLGPLRTLIRTREAGHGELVTLCAMCHNTLTRVNQLVKGDARTLARMHAYLVDEPRYAGDVEVVHFLSLLDRRLAAGTLTPFVTRPLTGLRVAPYYGCTLVRPAGAAIDDSEAPQIMERLLTALGADVVSDPWRTECCGAYVTVERPEAARVRAQAIHGSASGNHAELLVTMCPLCDFNLDRRGAEAQAATPGFTALPVVYFTQLLALALGRDPQLAAPDERGTDPRPALAACGLLDLEPVR